ncbi:hypothetical protein BHE74_00051747 [Ensete ventricosum]|nr:hypothetical protein BHE74_00051747 [Ensete ventricosum]
MLIHTHVLESGDEVMEEDGYDHPSELIAGAQPRASAEGGVNSGPPNLLRCCILLHKSPTPNKSASSAIEHLERIGISHRRKTRGTYTCHLQGSKVRASSKYSLSRWTARKERKTLHPMGIVYPAKRT